MVRIFRNGLTYGIVFFVLSFLLDYYSFRLPLIKSFIVAAPIGVCALLLNGLFYSRFAKSSKKLSSISIHLPDSGELKVEAPANHSIDDHLIAGKLFLTDKRLVFKSYAQAEYSWFLHDLHPGDFYPSIFSAGGEFILRDKEENRLVFEVDEIKIWKKELLKLLNSQIS